MPYRPSVSYRNGTRTLNYPPVGNSVLRHQMHPSANSLNSGYALQRTGHLHQPGNLRETTNLHRPAIGNALAGLSGLDRDTVRRERREKFLSIGRVL